MKTLVRFLSVPVSILFFVSILSCTKEIVRETIVHKDSIIIRTDSIIIIRKDTVSKLFQRRWNLLSHEFEKYSGEVLVYKEAENFVSNGFYWEFKPGGTYQAFDLGGNSTGTWQLLSDNHYVLDKNTVNERYYYILSISETKFINRGPFSKDNHLVADFLFTAYFTTSL